MHRAAEVQYSWLHRKMKQQFFFLALSQLFSFRPLQALHSMWSDIVKLPTFAFCLILFLQPKLQQPILHPSSDKIGLHVKADPKKYLTSKLYI